MQPLKVLLLIIVVLFTVLTIFRLRYYGTVTFDDSVTNVQYIKQGQDCGIMRKTINTNKGVLSYAQLYSTLMKADYTLANRDTRGQCRSTVFPTLISRKGCADVFDEWLDILDHYKQTTDPPPKEVPKERRSDYLTGGFARLFHWYINEKVYAVNSKEWSTKMISKFVENVKTGKLKFTYGVQTTTGLVNAARAHRPSGRGLVLGSQSPWVEAIMLEAGARHITTVEYTTLIINDTRIDYLSPRQFATRWNSMEPLDFVASFSSLEHSGLGRYGDPLDPFGDLKEMQKLRCVLKPGGLLYVGVPTGRDAVAYNAHRVYGAVRWPMLAAGFVPLAGYSHRGKTPVDLDAAFQFGGGGSAAFEQITIVLQRL